MKETNHSQIEINAVADGQMELIINTEPVSRFVTTVLLILTIITFSLPVIIGGTLILSGSKIGIGFLIPAGLFIFIGVFIYRSYLWNAYGREVFLFKQNSVKYHCDYKRFQDRKIQLEGEFSFFLQKVGEEERETKTLDGEDLSILMRLHFYLIRSEESFDSQINVPESAIRSAMAEVQAQFGPLESTIIDEENE